MKSMSIVLASAILTFTVAPAMSQPTKAERDECMLAAKNCTDQVDDIYNRMHRLDKEVKKGKKVYTPAELKKLHDKLAETQDLLKTLEKPGK
jgi:uncharacterized protein YecE (DUF72 family)